MATVIEKRVNKALDTIRLIGNRTADVENTEQADAVEAAILDALSDTMARLRRVKQARKTFSL